MTIPWVIVACWLTGPKAPLRLDYLGRYAIPARLVAAIGGARICEPLPAGPADSAAGSPETVFGLCGYLR